MPDKLFELLIRHFDIVRTSAIHKADYLAFNFKNEEAIGIDLDPFGYFFEGRCFVAFISSGLDFKAANCVGRLGVSKFVHALTICAMDRVAKPSLGLLAASGKMGSKQAFAALHPDGRLGSKAAI